MKKIETGFSGTAIKIVYEFNSIHEFIEYLDNGVVQPAFKPSEKFKTGSFKKFVGGDDDNDPIYWSGTKTYEKARELCLNGWSFGAKRITNLVKTSKLNDQQMMVLKPYLSQCGYQAIVPLYLQGVPNNMVNKKMTQVKQKVLNITRVLCASSSVSCSDMFNESVKVYQILSRLEQAGYQINLDLMISTGVAAAKIRLKSAGERINVSKLAFPLVHVAMFRRLYFRFIEVTPEIPGSFSGGYGKVLSTKEMEAAINRISQKTNNIVLPTLLGTTWSGENLSAMSIDQLLEGLK